MRFKHFLGLLAIVCIAHYVLLTLTLANYSINKPTNTPVWSTRSLQVGAAQPSAPNTLAQAATPAPAPKPAAPARPKPAADASSLAANSSAGPSPAPDLSLNTSPEASSSFANSPTQAATAIFIENTANVIVAPSLPTIQSVAITNPPATLTPSTSSIPLSVNSSAAPSPRKEREAGTAGAAQASGTGTAYKIPGSFTLRFAGTGSNGAQPVQASGSLVWRQDGSQYEAKLEAGALFFTALTQTSVGALGESGLAPKRFSNKTRSEQAAHFERELGRISFSNQKPAAPLLSGAQDRLSILVQLAAQLAAAPQLYPRASTIAIQIASVNEADTWLFTIEGDEALQLPAGNMQATKLTRLPRREYDDRLDIWFAPSLGHLPVRIMLTASNGNVSDLQLRSASSP